MNHKKDEMSYIPDIMTDYFKNKKMNLEMLKDYITIVVNIHYIENKKHHHHKYKMEYCTKELFAEYGMEIPDEEFEDDRLCANIPKDEKLYKV